MGTYSMQCPMAARRLIHSGMPATLEHGRPRSDTGGSSAVAVAETVQHFITAMDAVKLNMAAVDQLYPCISDIMQSMLKVQNLPPDQPGRQKVKGWMSKLHSMPASYELNEAEVRQLLFDLESAYNEFMSTLQR